MRGREEYEESLARCGRQMGGTRLSRERIRRQRRGVIDWALAGVEPPLDDGPAEVEEVARELLETV